jgi:hypothetical protein
MDPKPSQKPIEGLTLQEKEVAKSLESVPLLTPRDKVFLILIWRKLKTASPVSVPSDASSESIVDLEERIKKAGLFCNFSKNVSRGELGVSPGRILFVANNENDLNLISQLWFGRHLKDPQVYKEVGRMSGFPKTAIETYDQFVKLRGPARKELVLSREEQEELIPKELLPFSEFFYLSKAHFKTEIEVVRRWVEELKLVTPEVYKEYLAHGKQTR